MLLLIGLGNPGAEHAKNRHNIGFMAIDRIAAQHGFSDWRKKFKGLMSEGRLGEQKVILLKPETFMNESGKSVAEAVRLYKQPLEHIIVFYDELDLAPGKLRMKQGGGLAGHNGLKSLKAHIGDAFRRARLGIGHPGHKDKVLSYVLSDFKKTDMVWLEPLLDAVGEYAPLLAEGEDATFQTRVQESVAGAMNHKG